MKAARSPRLHVVEPKAEPDGKPVVPITSKLLLDDAETGALLGLSAGSVTNLESRDQEFPRPVEWVLDRKLRRRADVESYVAKLKQRRA